MSNDLYKEALHFGREYLVSALGELKGSEAYLSIVECQKDEVAQVRMLQLIIRHMEHKRLKKKGRSPLEEARAVKYKPVGVKRFVEDKYYLDSKGVLYPEVLKCLEDINSGEYQEAVLTGAIGTGKSTIALYSIAYQLYLLSCYRNPHDLFGLDPSSEIMFIFQSINAKLAKSVDYERFRAMIEKSEYFKERFPFDKGILSEMKFPNRIIIKPISGAETGAIGQNVIGGMIDEMNFMAVVEKSKASVDGGTYDQAIALYNSIARRRKSRFMVQGKLPGLLCLVSSKRYPGQFTDKKEEEAKKEIDLYGKSSIYVYDKRTWDIKPAGSFSGKWFQLFIGDAGRKPRILEEDEEVSIDDVSLVMSIPEEYRLEFETDMMNSLRDIAGVSTLATHPFIHNRDSILQAMRKTHIMVGRTTVDFVTTKVEIDITQVKDKHLPRFAHIDLAVTGDSAGLVIGAVTGFKQVQRGESVETLPNIWIDLALEVKPPKGGEILFHKIREVLYVLRKLGLNIRWVTFDQFQSVDSMQILRQQGFTVGRQSMDVTTVPYEFTKSALYDGRLSIPHHAKLQSELASLEHDVKKNKIDHPPHSCLIAETPVACYDGKVRTMGQLVHDYEVYGVEHMGVSWDVATGKVVNLPMLKPHLTKYVTEIVEVEMENGERFRCTPDHLFLLDYGEYKAAEYLLAGEELKS